jgi:hypothetical protein
MCAVAFVVERHQMGSDIVAPFEDPTFHSPWADFAQQVIVCSLNT